MIWNLIHKKNDVNDEKLSHKEYLEYIKKLGEDLIQEMKNSTESNLWDQYNIAIGLKTYNRFIGDIANQCLTEIAIKENQPEIDAIQTIHDKVNIELNENISIISEHSDKFEEWLYNDI